ncbi:MAG: site-specific integrase [Phycisphaerales bacterium]|nr:site-specific integrase [Phycisphaerales bacterium]MCB9856529.1 site-specific integrase [Phycisphaerales bacterium]
MAKQFFRAAVRRKLIRENPFGHLVGAIRANKTREYFVTQADAERIIDKCPDAEWRLLFGLSRYGGVRCPSETLGIRWDHVDWERSRITVRSPKTEHHVGGESREIPIFPELRPLLEDAYELAQPGAEYLIARYRETSVNLRTQLKRIIKRAKLQPWPKLFHNLRATRETELAETYPAHVVCAWIGNSQSVAQRHYLQVTDEHFERGARCEALQNALQTVQESPCTDANANDDERAETPVNSGVFADIQSDSYLDKMAGLGVEGLEPPTLSV